MTQQDVEEIKGVIEQAYIRGIHGDQDRSLIDGGFHPVFEMLVLAGNRVERVDVDQWLSRIDAMKQDNPGLWSAATVHEFLSVDVTGSAAFAKLDVHKGDVHYSTDFMLLYRVEGGWRIVSKVFSVPG